MPALLLEDLRRQARMEHRIEIHVDEVVEVLNILACYRIAGLVRKRHGIEKSVERALQQFDKRLFDRIFARSAQYRVLQDVGDTGGIRRRSTESDAEHLVFIGVDEGDQLRAGGDMVIIARRSVDFRQLLLADQLKAVGRDHSRSSRGWGESRYNSREIVTRLGFESPGGIPEPPRADGHGLAAHRNKS